MSNAPSDSPEPISPTPPGESPGAPATPAAPVPMQVLPPESAGIVRRFDGLLSRFFGYPLLTAQVILYAVIAWGVFGAEFGLSDLFWNENFITQCWCGAAACWLFGTVVFVNMLLVGPHGLPGKPSEEKASFRYEGHRTLFPSRNPGVRWAGVLMVRWLLVFLAALYLGKWVAVLLNKYYIKPVGDHPVEEFLGQYFGFPFIVGYLLSFFFAAGVSALAHFSNAREWLADREWLQKSFNDPSIAVPTDSEWIGRGRRTALPATEVPLLPDGCLFLVGLSDTRIAAYNLRTLVLLHAMAAFFAAVIVVLIIGNLLWIADNSLAPFVLLSLLLMFLDVGGGLIAFRVPAPRALGVVFVGALLLSNPVLVLLCLVWVAWGLAGDIIPKRIRKFRMFGVALLLVAAVVTDDHVQRLITDRHTPRVTTTYSNIGGKHGTEGDPNGGGGEISYDDPLPLSDVHYEKIYRKRAPTGGLIAGKTLLGTYGQKSLNGKAKPRLVVVATSGGGIRAAVWTGVVLEGLEEEFDGTADKPVIRDHIRIFAGSSGGMVGAGAYVADFQDEPLAKRQLPGGGRDKETGLLPLSHALAKESLSSVVQTMIVQDFTVNTLFPFRVGKDRGRILEDQWNRNFEGWTTSTEKKTPFERSIRGLRDKEADCKRPSLIFSPTMVEDSKRLLVSNLDLDPLTRPSAYRADKSDPGPAHPPVALSLPTVEFFRLFPGSDDFTVGSAARMSASFPVLSPAVAIPATPQRRVVDAGYFDNYGIDILANWLLHHRQDIADNTSGVLLIQIRAYPLDKGGRGFEDETPSPVEQIVGAVSAPLQAVLTARGSAAYHRNNEQLAELHRAFNGDPGLRNNFFTTVVFEQQQDSALSWYITTPQKKQVAEGFYKKDGDAWKARKDDNPDKDIRGKLDAIKVWLNTP